MTRYIFCANPGRCGSAALANYFAKYPDVRAEHEPNPRPGDDWMQMQRALLRRQQWAKDQKLYIETSQGFIKYFFQVALSYLSDIGIIMMFRDPIAVAYRKSASKSGPTIDRSTSSLNSLPFRGVFFPRFDPSWSRFDACLWEWFEICARALHLIHLGVDHFVFPFDAIADKNLRTLKSLVEWAGVEYDPAVFWEKKNSQVGVNIPKPDNENLVAEASRWLRSLTEGERDFCFDVAKRAIYNNLIPNDVLIMRAF